MLINLRNALMSGKRLPYDAEIEYLECTGTQYVKVPMVVDNSATVNITGYTGISNTELFSFDMEKKKSFNIESGATYYRWWTNNYINLGSGYVGVLHSYKCNSSIWVDGVLKGTSTATDTDNTTAFYIFKGVHNPARGRIYHVSVEYGGRLIFDGIPVRKGTVGYLYDRVTRKLFGNAGTGDFVLGPDVVPVEYIESHGTEWIDTGVIPGGKVIGAEITFRVSSYMGSENTNGLFGSNANDGSDNCQFTIFNSQWRTKLGNMGYYSGTPDKAVHDLRLNSSNGTWLDNTNITPATFTIPATNTRQLQLFSTNYALPSNFYHMVGYVYSCKIFDSNLVLRSFRPVRVGTDATSWEGAMMDVLTRRIYRNAGTGAFTFGNDLRYPIPAE